MKILFVISGKGGVGKSTFSVLLALYLNKLGKKVSILDLDICGPSISCLLGVKEASIIKDENGRMIPYEHNPLLNSLSMSYFLTDPNSAIIWRGPRKNCNKFIHAALINELYKNVDWGQSEFLIIDTPPGIQDEHITLAENSYNQSNVGAIVVTSPHVMSLIIQDLSIDDVRRQLTFCHKTGIKLIGMVENMKNFSCPHCDVRKMVLI